MNPDQPSREQVEARLTALLLGELPAAEAELLRWTIARDPELQKLHDQLKLTIGFVSEAMKHPAGAQVEKETPLKLSEERRQKLLAHFKTERPEPLVPPLSPKKFPLIPVLVAIALITMLAAISVPNFVKSRATSQLNACINNLRQIDAAKNEWARENGKPNGVVVTEGDITPYIQLDSNGNVPKSPAGGTYVIGKVGEPAMEEYDGKLLTADYGNLQATRSAMTAHELSLGIDNTRQSTAGGDFYSGRVTTISGRATTKHLEKMPPAGIEQEFAANSQQPTTPPAMAPIALPNTESTQDESGQNAGPEVYSQSVVGYVNVTVTNGTSAMVANQLDTGTASSVPVVEVSPGASGGDTLPQPEGETASTISTTPPTAPAASAPEATPTIAAEQMQPDGVVPPSTQASTSPQSEGEVTTFGSSAPQASTAPAPMFNGVLELPRDKSKFNGKFAPQAASKEEKSDRLALVPPRLRQQYTDRNRLIQGFQPPQHKLVGVTPIGGIPTSVDNRVASVPEGMFASTVESTVKNGNNFNTGATGGDGAGGQNNANMSSISGTPAGGNYTFNSPGNQQSLSSPTDQAHRSPSSISGGAGFASGSIKNPFVARMQTVVAYATNGSSSAVQPFNFPDQSAANQPPFIARENQNAQTVGQTGDAARVGTINPATGLPETTVVAQGGNAGSLDIPQQSQQEYRLKYSNSTETQAGEMKTPASAAQADKPLSAPMVTAPTPQPEIQTSDNAFSTFSLNVSDVSFKLASVSLGNGQMPPPASIRSEEFINAFDYHDPEPLQGQPLSFTFERARDPFAQERDLLRFSVKAAAVGRQEGRALNLVLLLDTSGSMERADRVAIIRSALRVLASQLQPQDTVSVVTFARSARLWADGVPGDQAGATLDKVGSITPEGGTNLEEAMRLAYETALRHFLAGGINRVVLLTDGAANLGNVDPQALTQKVEAERRQGIAFDCFGIGWEDYNDDLLEQLSSNGDGRYAFINSPDEAATEFAAKLAGALQVAAEDVKVQVEFNPDRVTAWRQIGYAKHQLTKQQFRDNSVAAGTIASREAGNALYVIETKPDGQGPIATVRVRYRVPGTQENHERSWLVDDTGGAPALAQSSSAMRLAVSAAEFSEWLADSPYAQNVTLDELLNDLDGIPQIYGTDERPKQLEWMIRQAKSVSGK